MGGHAMPEIMKIRNQLSEDDIRRTEGVEPTPLMIAKANYCGIEACDVFAKKFLNPIIATQLSLSDREKTIVGHYYRIIAYGRSLLALNDAIHFQSVASAARSILELYLDMEIFHRNLFADGVLRVAAFVEAQKLKAARKTLAFFAANPTLLASPSAVNPQDEYVRSNEARIDAQSAGIWGQDRKGKPKVPDHWTEWDVKSRATKLGKEFELLVNDGYDHRNFLVHTGITGVSGLNQTDFTILCALSYKTIHACILGAFTILVKEVKLEAALEPFDEQREQLRRIPLWVLADEVLKSRGEPGRFALEI
jgi:hypothetical protein